MITTIISIKLPTALLLNIVCSTCDLWSRKLLMSDDVGDMILLIAFSDLLFSELLLSLKLHLHLFCSDDDENGNDDAGDGDK